MGGGTKERGEKKITGKGVENFPLFRRRKKGKTGETHSPKDTKKGRGWGLKADAHLRVNTLNLFR